MADLEKKEEKSRQWKPYSCSELSAFCLQVSLLLEAAVPLDEGFSIMAEDAADEKERQMLLYMSEGAELGDPCFKIFKDTGVFPDYVIRLMDPKYIEVWGKFTPRGGISIDPYCNYGKKDTLWEKVAFDRLTHHDMYPEKIDNR